MNPQIISFNCTLKSKTGKLISLTYNRDVLTLTDDKNPQLMGLSRGLQNIKKGEKRKIILTAEEAYGFYDPQKVILYPIQKLSKDIRIGQSVNIVGKSGAVRTYTIAQIHKDMVSLDGNHPLAGQDLIFEIEAIDVRDATQEELNSSSNGVTSRHLH